MEAAAFCTVVSTVLSITPNRSQMFQYESLRFSCEVQENYTLKRNLLFNGGICSTDCQCPTDWGRIHSPHCVIKDLYPEDTGVYWCESGQGACSDAVNITVTEGDVILESPVLPVTEGSDVTLRCWYTNKTTGKPSSDLPADFYKDGSLVRTESTGQMTIHSVYKSDEGFYKCNISDLGESPESWMDVRGVVIVNAKPPHFNAVHIPLPALGGVGLLLASLLSWSRICRKKRGRGEVDLAAQTYTDITFTEPAQTTNPTGGWAMDSPLYSLFIQMDSRAEEGHRRMSPAGLEPWRTAGSHMVLEM